MSDNQKWTLREAIFAALAITFVLLLHGAVPFLMMPTLGQASWSMGFSQSFANGSLFSVHAHDFGLPQPAAIAFGLAGAWPASLLIRLGLHAADAYSGMAACWLLLGLFSACRIGRRFGASRSISLLGGIAWMSMPIIWGHAPYSMLSLGIALLPFYFLSAFRLFLIGSEKSRIPVSAIALYFAAAIVAIFMDGYTFMMFAAGASILLLHAALTRPRMRLSLMRVALPVHGASFALAYVLYSSYIGTSGFEADSIDFFRAWGLDLSYIAIPTRGMLWLPDMLGLSLGRSDEIHFGDSSVWSTTFSLPVLLLGLIAWWCTRAQVKMSSGILLVALFSFYMALGPSLKLNSTKPASLQLTHPRQQSALMPAELAVISSGNAWISENLPGFKIMRASYRWSALGIFALWLLIMIRISGLDKKNRVAWLSALTVMTLINLPDLQQNWQNGIDNRSMLQQIDRDLVANIGRHVRPGETTVFIPWRNDFIANYLAPAARFLTFNAGGDKNLAAAQASWSPEMIALGSELDTEEAPIAAKLLVDGTADVVVLPYFHMLWSAHLWPCLAETRATLSEEDEEDFRRTPGFLCPAERRNELQPFVLALKRIPYVEVVESTLFATIRLRPEFAGSEKRAALTKTILENIQYPIVLGAGVKEVPYMLRAGWHGPEANHVWSQGAASLMLPVPRDCEARHCEAVLKFAAYGASQQRPLSIVFANGDQSWQWHERIVASSGRALEVTVPLVGATGGRSISIAIPDATSPRALTGSPDARILGIALKRIDLSYK
ncbi:MAG: hypothetical protein V4632_17965 [Pseudomonadota bacterium]